MLSIVTVEFEDKYAKDQKYCKVRDHSHYTGEYRGVVHSICNLKYSVPKETLMLFHNGSNYDYHFIIKEFAEEFEGQFTCLGQNTEKYITFSIPTKEVRRIDKSGRKIKRTISCRLHFNESSIYIAKSLLNLVNYLAEGIHKIKCKQTLKII